MKPEAAMQLALEGLAKRVTDLERLTKDYNILKAEHQIMKDWKYRQQHKDDDLKARIYAV